MTFGKITREKSNLKAVTSSFHLVADDGGPWLWWMWGFGAGFSGTLDEVDTD
jgi:hypothetical protein